MTRKQYIYHIVDYKSDMVNIYSVRVGCAVFTVELHWVAMARQKVGHNTLHRVYFL